MPTLVIVESPAKIQKIQGFLGQGYTVAASVGHFRDLPAKSFGMNLATYEPEWAYDPDKASVISKLKEKAAQADLILLATDPDREGEAIAWHLEHLLRPFAKPMKRIVFNEITPDAIKRAVQSPRAIDGDLVMAQIGRRLIDRVVGYSFSPAIRDLSGISTASAGRVQSVVCRVLVERENDIRSFKQLEHYSVSAIFGGWTATLKTKPFLKDDEEYLLDKGLAAQIAQCKDFKIVSISEGERKVAPPAPFITSTLQLACTNVLGFSPADTMKHAQALFDQGFITYLRTDSPALSDDAFAKLQAAAPGLGIQIVNAKRIYKSKGNAQEAHECIRPTDYALQSLENLDLGADKAQLQAVYSLIWRRAVASQMPDATYKFRKALLESWDLSSESLYVVNGIVPQFEASGSVLISEGFKALMASDVSAEEEAEEDKETIPLSVTEGSYGQAVENKIVVKHTQPKKRFTQAGIVAYMEKRGIGRPSTYASILHTLLKNNYATEEQFKGTKGKSLVPTDYAQAIVKALIAANCSFINIDYTSQIEKRLDDIAEGKSDYKPLVAQEHKTALAEIENLKGTMTYSGPMCPTCDSAPFLRILKKDKSAYFWSCKNWQESKCPPFEDLNGVPALPTKEHLCLKCKSPYVLKSGKYGLYWRCTKQDCRFWLPDVKGKPLTGEKCGSKGCTGILIKKKSAKGEFYSCALYPDCKYVCPSVNGQPKKN